MREQDVADGYGTSAAVYGVPAGVPITEVFPSSHTNLYGHTKDSSKTCWIRRLAQPAWRIGVLRYFGPIGAHTSGPIGDDPAGIPTSCPASEVALASGKPVSYQVGERGPGDVAQCYANPALGQDLLGWSAKRSLEEMCPDAWRWQSGNPNGYLGRT